MEQNTPTTETEVRAEASLIVQRANALVITDNETYTSACDMENRVKAMIKIAKGFFDPLVDTANKAHKMAVQRRSSVLDPLEAAYKTRKTIRIAWEDEQERIRKAEEARLEAIARAEEEKRRAEELAILAAQKKAEEEALLAAAAEAEKAGKKEEAEALVEQAVETNQQMAEQAEAIKQTPVYVAPVTLASTKPKVAGTSAAQTRWDFRFKQGAENPLAWVIMLVNNPKLTTTEKVQQLRDELQSLNGYVQWNEPAVRKVVTALKDQTRIPGIEPYSKRV